MKIFNSLVFILVSSVFKVSLSITTQTRWVVNRSLETWKIRSKQTSIVIHGILDPQTHQVDTLIDQETFTDHVAGGYREWSVHPDQILLIDYQLLLAKHTFMTGRWIDDHPLRITDHDSIYVDYSWEVLVSNNVRVGAKINGVQDILRFNYPSSGDVVIWGPNHEQAKGTLMKSRWIRNRSSSTWRFYARDGSIIIDGFVDGNGFVDYTILSQLIAINNGGYKVWEIKAGQILQIRYRIDYDAPEGTGKILSLQDSNGELMTREWSVVTKRFWDTIWIVAEPVGAKIEHNGHRNPVNLNHPGEGDIDIYGDLLEAGV